MGEEKLGRRGQVDTCNKPEENGAGEKPHALKQHEERGIFFDAWVAKVTETQSKKGLILTTN